MSQRTERSNVLRGSRLERWRDLNLEISLASGAIGNAMQGTKHRGNTLTQQRRTTIRTAKAASVMRMISCRRLPEYSWRNHGLCGGSQPGGNDTVSDAASSAPAMKKATSRATLPGNSKR